MKAWVLNMSNAVIIPVVSRHLQCEATVNYLLGSPYSARDHFHRDHHHKLAMVPLDFWEAFPNLLTYKYDKFNAFTERSVMVPEHFPDSHFTLGPKFCRHREGSPYFSELIVIF